jgi:hypothetical protein
LARAGRHARLALAEAVHAVRALLDALAIASTGAPSQETERLARLATSLDSLAGTLAGARDEPGTSLFSAVLGALDQEISRWEERSRHDREARAVLRAFLGLRELLWELGVRPEEGEARGNASRSHSTRPASRGPRVQRVTVEG